MCTNCVRDPYYTHTIEHGHQQVAVYQPQQAQQMPAQQMPHVQGSQRPAARRVMVDQRMVAVMTPLVAAAVIIVAAVTFHAALSAIAYVGAVLILLMGGLVVGRLVPRALGALREITESDRHPRS